MSPGRSRSRLGSPDHRLWLGHSARHRRLREDLWHHRHGRRGGPGIGTVAERRQRSQRSWVMLIPRTRYTDIIADLDALREAARELRIGCPSDRLGALSRRISTLQDLQGNADGLVKFSQQHGDPALAWNLVEALEFSSVWKAFGPDLSRILELLAKALEGSADPAAEGTKGDKARARNVMFELRLAAFLTLRGVAVEFREPDLRITLAGWELLIACKRPASRERVVRNVRNALSQIRKARASSRALGMVAISVSRLLENTLPPLPGTPFAEELSDRLADHVERELEPEIQEARKLMRDTPEGDLLLLHMSKPVWVDDEAILTWTEQSVVRSSPGLDPAFLVELQRVLA